MPVFVYPTLAWMNMPAAASAQADPDTAQADTAPADALTGIPTALADALKGTMAFEFAQDVPTTPVQAAWFGCLDFARPSYSVQAAVVVTAFVVIVSIGFAIVSIMD